MVCIVAVKFLEWFDWVTDYLIRYTKDLWGLGLFNYSILILFLRII